MLVRLVDRAFENPAMSGGLVVMALTATAIMSNAMFLQSGRHPEPLFNTRPAAVAREVAKAPAVTPAPAARPQATTALPPVPRTAPQTKPAAPTPAMPVPPRPVASPASLVSATQRELARLGMYAGTIDGMIGSRTRAAISNYQTTAGLTATGEPSPELLTALRQASANPAVAPPAPAPASTAAKPDQVAAAVERAAELEREQQAAAQSDRLRRIQSVLDQIGYGPLAADGQANAATADAIRRFELDNGLPVTGEASDRVIARLVAIGAIKQN
jgi:peptidoglycan hydrolase-like protein with peptidoglycan-binding domain